MTISSYLLAIVVVIIRAYNTILIKLGVVTTLALALTTLHFILIAILIVPFTHIRRIGIGL